MEVFGEPRWFKNDNGTPIPIYDGYNIDQSMEIRQHYRIIQSIVDTYPHKFPKGRNVAIVDNYVYRFNVAKKDRKIKLISREKYGEDTNA